ncbi:MAG: hypothetical protein M0Z42_12635 [Actinomycetota bacterium]|nr:hypothetical protein [Actinomycetota bacterium]
MLLPVLEPLELTDEDVHHVFLAAPDASARWGKADRDRRDRLLLLAEDRRLLADHVLRCLLDEILPGADSGELEWLHVPKHLVFQGGVPVDHLGDAGPAGN